jgi:hypothetical protein
MSPTRCTTASQWAAIDIELVERLAAEVSEVLLYLHLDIVPRKIGA